MPAYDYTVRVNLDGPGFEKQYQKYNAKMEKLANGNWKVHLEPDEKDIMRMVQEINKTHPEMIVQLKYVINETEIQAEQKKLESMKTVLDVSPKANVAAFSKIVDEVEQLYIKLEDEGLSKDTSKGLSNSIRTKLKSAAEIYAQMKSSDDSYRVFVSGVGEKLDSYRQFMQDFNLGSYSPAPVDSSDIDAQIEKIEQLKQRRDELIKQGAEPLPGGSAGKASQEADQLAGHLDKASQKADQLNEKLEGKGHKVTIFDGIKEETYDTIKDLDRLKDKLTEIAKSGNIQWHAGNLTKDILNGGNFGKADTLKEWIESELESAGTADVYLQPWLSQLFKTSTFDIPGWEGAASDFSGVKNKRLYAIDTSRYNMLEIANDEFEADYREGFGMDLSTYILSRIKAIVDPSLLSQQIKESIDSLTSGIEYDDPEKYENELFEKYKSILTRLGVSFETYKNFLRQEIGNAENFPLELEALNSETYKTRFERYAIPGIQGIDIGKTISVNDTTIGSTIFDVDKTHPFTIDFGAIEDAASEDVRSMLYHFQEQLIGPRITDILRQNPEWASSPLTKEAFFRDLSWLLGSEDAAKAKLAAIKIDALKGGKLSPDVTLPTVNTQEFEQAGKEAGEAFVSGVVGAIQDGNGQISNAVNEWTDLLNKDFSTTGKKDATSQLASASKEYTAALARNGEASLAEWDEAGIKAGFTFIKAYNEAVNQGIAKSSLEKYGQHLVGYDKESIAAELEEYKVIMQDYAKITSEIGNRPITEEVLSSIREYVKYLDLARTRQAFGNQDVSNELELANQARERAISLAQAEADKLAATAAAAGEATTAEEQLAKAKGDTANTTTSKSEEETQAVVDQTNAVEKETEAVENLAKAKNELAVVSKQSADAQTESTNAEAKEVGETASETTQQLANEANALETVSDASKKAAKGKASVAKENVALAETANATTPAVTEESTALQKLEEEGALSELQDGGNNGAVAITNTTTAVSKLGKELDDSTKKALVLADIVKNRYGYDLNPDDLITNAVGNRSPENNVYRLGDYRRLSVTEAYDQNGNYDPTLRQTTSYKQLESETIRVIGARIKAESALRVEQAKGIRSDQAVIASLKSLITFYTQMETSLRGIAKAYDLEPTDFSYAIFDANVQQRTLEMMEKQDVAESRSMTAVKDVDNRQAIKSYNDLIKVGAEYYELRDKEVASTISNEELSRLAELRQAWSDATAARNEYAYGGGSLGGKADELHSTFDQKAYEEAQSSALSKLDEFQEKLKEAVSGGFTEGLQNAAQRISNGPSGGAGFSDFRQEFLNGLHGYGTGDISALFATDDIRNFLAAMDSDFYKTASSANKELDVLGGNIQSILQKSSGMHSGLKQGFQELYRDVMLLNNGMGVSQGALDDVNARFEELQHQLKASGREGKSLASLVGNQLSNSLSQLVHRYLSVYAMARYARQMVTVIKEIDTSLTELRKVSDASTYRLQQSLLKSTETAKELGATIRDVIDATADWARLGYDVGTAEKLARVATLYKNVGDNISIEDANSSLISTLKAYSYLPEEAESIVDKFNEVANNFAIESGGIGNALQRSAAAFNAANTDLSKSIALITAANEVVQNPEQVGTMWTTVSARIRGAKAELTSLDEETDEYVESTSKLRNLVKQISGVDIMANETTFKDIYTIVVEIAEVWDGINDVNRAALLEALAGKRQANRLVAAIENVDTLKRAYQTAEESQGSAMREQANYAKSIQYSLDRFTASLQELSTTLLGSESLKTILDTGNSLIEGFTKLLSSDLGKIAGGVIGGSALMKLLGVGGTLQFGKDGQSVARFINPLGFLGQGVQGKQLVSADVLREINLYNAQYRASINPNIMAPTPVLGAGYFSAESEKIIGTADHLVDTSLLTTQTMRQLLIQQAKAVAMSAAIAAAVAVGVGIIKSLITASDRLAKKASSVGEDFKNAESSLKSYRQRIDELRETLDSPTSSIEEQVAARKQLLSIQSEMIDQYGEEAEKVNLLTARTIQLDGAFLKLAKQQWQDISKEINQSDDFFDTIGDFLANVATGSKNNADRLMKEVDGYSIDNSLRVLLRGRSDLLGDTGQSALSRIDQAGGSNIYDRLTDLEIIRASLSNSNLDENDSTLSRLDSEIEEVKEKIAEVDDFVQSSVLYNEILSADSDSKEVGYYKQITELYDSYQQALVNGEDELAERLKVKTTGALVDAITDGDLSDSVQRYFANMFPALEPELSDEKLLRGLQDSDFVERLQAAIEAGGYQYIDDIGTKQDSEMAEIYTSLGYESAESFVKGLEKGNFYTPLDIKKYRSQLSRSLSALSTGTSTREELDRVKEYTKDFTVAQIKAWLEATKGAVTATEAITKYEWAIRSATDYTAALTDEFSELVDKAQDDVSSISDALTKVFAGTMSSSDLIDLYQKFPELSKESDSLGKALQDLALNKINAVIEKLEEAGANRDILIFLRTLRAETEKTFSNMEEVAGYTSAQMANDGLSVLSSIRQDVEDRGEFDYSSVLGNSFKEQFGGLDSYADFVKTVAEHNDDIEKTQQLFDQLATEWLYSTEMLANLNEENKHFAIKDLSDQGVSNAQEVVESTLKFRENYGDILDILGQIVLAEGEVSDAQAEEARSALELLGIDNSEAAVKQALIEKDAMLKAGITDLNSATASQIDYFSRLINEAGVTNSYMSQLYFTSLQYSGLNIDSTDKIDQILAVARAAGTSTGYVTALQTALERLFTASQQMTGLKNGAYKVRATNSSHNAKKAAKYATEYMEDTITTGYNNARADVDSMMKEIQSILQKSAAVNLDIGKIKGFTGKPSSSSGSSSGAGSDAANEFLEVMDWIEVRISRIERDIENLDQTADATWRKWTDRTKALTSEIADVNKEIEVQQAGLVRYMQEAESVGLSSYYKQRVRNGEIDIERITDEDLKQQIDDYTEWYIMMPPRTVMCAEKPYLIAGTPLEALCHNVKMKQAYA